MKMKYNLAVTLMTLMLSGSVVFANGMAFEPLDFNVGNSISPEVEQSLPEIPPSDNEIVSKTYIPPSETKTCISQPTTTSSSIANTSTVQTTSDNTINMKLLENQKMQSALVDLDYSQVEIRNKLSDLEKQYAEVDASYEKYKAERKSLNKQVKQTKKRVKNLEKIKERIRNNMI